MKPSELRRHRFAIAKASDGRPLSELRRRRIAEIAASGKTIPPFEEYEALMDGLAKRPGLDELIAEGDREVVEFLRKLENRREMRRHARPREHEEPSSS